MPLQAGDYVAQERVLLSTPNSSTNTRWIDADLLQLTTRAVRHVVAQVFFPESRVSIQTVANQQLYSVDPRGLGVHQIKRVYVNGQLATPTDIGRMEGDQTGNYDQSGYGSAASGGDGPTGAGGGGQPQWTVATPVSAPFLNSYGTPRATQNFYPGGPPRFYTRGGLIGIVPMINANAWITVDCVMVPDALTTLTDPVTLPDEMFDAVVWKVCEFAAFADSQSPGTADQRNYAMGQYREELKNIRTWKRQFEIENTASVPNTNRKFFRYGMNRTGF